MYKPSLTVCHYLTSRRPFRQAMKVPLDDIANTWYLGTYAGECLQTNAGTPPTISKLSAKFNGRATRTNTDVMSKDEDTILPKDTYPA